MGSDQRVIGGNTTLTVQESPRCNNFTVSKFIGHGLTKPIKSNIHCDEI